MKSAHSMYLSPSAVHRIAPPAPASVMCGFLKTLRAWSVGTPAGTSCVTPYLATCVPSRKSQRLQHVSTPSSGVSQLLPNEPQMPRYDLNFGSEPSDSCARILSGTPPGAVLHGLLAGSS